MRKSKSLKKSKSSKVDYYLNKGINKLKRDLDIVNLLEIVKGFYVMKQVLFSLDDRFLLKFQRRDIIHSSESDDDQIKELSDSVMG